MATKRKSTKKRDPNQIAAAGNGTYQANPSSENIDQLFQSVLQQFTTIMTRGAEVPLPPSDYKFTVSVKDKLNGATGSYSFMMHAGDLQAGRTGDACLAAGGRLPDAAAGVGAGKNASHVAAWRESTQRALLQRVGRTHPGEVEGRVHCIRTRHASKRRGCIGDRCVLRAVNDQEGAAVTAVMLKRRDRRRRRVDVRVAVHLEQVGHDFTDDGRKHAKERAPDHAAAGQTGAGSADDFFGDVALE